MLVILFLAIPGSFFAFAIKKLYSSRILDSRPEMIILVTLFVSWLVCLTYLLRLKVEVRPEAVVYVNLIRGRHYISRSEISSVFMEKRESGDGTKFKLIITPRITSKEGAVSIPLSLLCLRAAIELPKTLAAKERDSRDLWTLT